MSRSGIVTLTTDFGLSSSYAGSLRGILLSVFRDVVLADITHVIGPFAIGEGARVLHAAAPTFPPGTVHLAVVDPGVGTPRRPLIVAAAGHYFVGPDNGLFTPFLKPGSRAWAIDAAAVSPVAPSRTFHGRDLFAPVAARLAAGEEPEGFGAPVDDPVRLPWPEPEPADGGAWRGEVAQVDAFGNLVTNIPASLVARVDAAGGTLLVRAGNLRIRGLSGTYGEAAPGAFVALVGSSGFLEVALVRGNAARETGLGPGDPVVLGAG